MKIEFWYIGKTNEKYLTQGMSIFEKRLSHYCRFKSVCLKDVKPGQTSEETKTRESDLILSKLTSADHLVLLDETGNMFTSPKFSKLIEKLQLQSSKRIIFLVAGAFGASETLKKRAFTIIKNEKYHNV